MMIDWKNYQGVEVIEAQKDVPKRHPRYNWEIPGVFDNTTRLLLADGTELAICDLCPYNGITGYDPYVKPEVEHDIKQQSNKLLSHFSGKHWIRKPRGSMYADDQIKNAIKVWLKWKSSGVVNWGQSACDELNAAGSKPYRGETWTKGALGSLVKVYAKTKKFKSVRAASFSDADRVKINELLGKPTEEKKETDVPAGNGNPTLNIGAGGGGGAPGMTISMGSAGTAGGTSKGHQVAAPVEAPTVVEVEVELPSLYQHLGELDDGSPIFRYGVGKVLLVGKKIKGIEV